LTEISSMLKNLDNLLMPQLEHGVLGMLLANASVIRFVFLCVCVCVCVCFEIFATKMPQSVTTNVALQMQEASSQTVAGITWHHSLFQILLVWSLRLWAINWRISWHNSLFQMCLYLGLWAINRCIYLDTILCFPINGRLNIQLSCWPKK